MFKLIAFVVVFFVLASAAPVAAEDTIPQPKSPGMATGLALGGLLVPIGLAGALIDGDDDDSPAVAIAIAAGSIVGPGLGHAYAHESGRFWGGAAVRTLAWAAVFALVGTSSEGSDENKIDIVAVGAGAIYLYSAIRDVVKASDSVARYNEKIRARDVGVAPIYRPRDRAAGLAVAVGF